MHFISGNDLFQMFKYGTSFIVRKRKILNDINVFPVPDGDTGNNLALTLQTIVTTATPAPSFHVTLESISDAALVGARGNSGMIFAQFINGLRLASNGNDEVSLVRFTDMVNHSVNHVYHSLSQPVEGTILTVIKAWAVSLTKLQGIADSIKSFFLEAYHDAQIALNKTKEQLAVLKKRNVVDSGALGFVTFLEGINSYYNMESLDVDMVDDLLIEQDHSDDEVGEYRYCTEGLVKHDNQDENTILNALSDYGDSLIVAVGAHMFRIHIHTNKPAEVFQVLRQFGDIVAQKIDDMSMDINMKKSTKDTVIVTDSIADINQDFLLMNDVAVIPVNILIENVSYMDKIAMNNNILVELIEKGCEYPTTSTPSVKSVSTLFDKLFGIYKHVLVITVSSALSATHQVIVQEVNRLKESGKHIEIVDSMTNSVAEGLLVKHAVELLNDKHTIDEIKTILDEEKKRTEIMVCLETFKYATMSGRLPKAVGKIGMTFGIRPIMSIDSNGKGAAFGFALSQKGITKKIVKRMKTVLDKEGIQKYALVHCVNETLVNEYKELFTDLIGIEPEYITEVSSATAIHSGKGSVAIAFIKGGK